MSSDYVLEVGQEVYIPIGFNDRAVKGVVVALCFPTFKFSTEYNKAVVEYKNWLGFTTRCLMDIGKIAKVNGQ